MTTDIGLVTGARLREAGVDVRIIEKGGDFGGTWYWNRYHGAQCDTRAMVYLPLLEETGHVPASAQAQRPGCRRTRDGCVVQLLVNVDENGAVFDLACVNRDGAAGEHADGLAGGQVVA